MIELQFRGRTVVRDHALVMAIINRTPDSFYDKGATYAEDVAMEAVHRVVDEGADIVDIGGVKAGLLTGPAATLAGRIELVDVGIGADLATTEPLIRT